MVVQMCKKALCMLVVKYSCRKEMFLVSALSMPLQSQLFGVAA